MGSKKKTGLTPLDQANKKVRELEKRLKDAGLELEKVRKDQDKHQQFFKREFVAQLQCMRENNYYSPEAMIKKLAAHLNSCERFYLGF